MRVDGFQIGVTILIALLYLGTITSSIFPMFGFGIVGFLHAILFTAEVCMIFHTYFRAGFMSPGRVPTGWTPDSRLYYPLPDRKRRPPPGTPLAEGQSLQVTDPTTPRFCDLCNQYKPPRTHHCKYCNKCTVKMDHHCPWINNCVGHGNHKMFILFLFYAAVGLSYVVIVSIMRAYVLLSSLSKTTQKNPTDLILVILVCVMAFSVGMGIIMLAAFQSENVLKNVTTLERDSCEVFKRKARKERKKFYYPYEMSSQRANWTSVFGENKIDWLKPTETVSHDGTYWNIREEFLELLRFETV